MAQETAGTIGIPVLKNELLPYLTDYAKRSERAELYKQKAQQRAAELAAKKAAEDAKYVPKFEAGLGSDMWEHVDRAKNEADIQQGLALAKDQTVPRQQVMAASNEINRKVSQRSNISKQLKENTLKTAEDLKNRYRKVGPEYAYQWAKQQQDYKSPEEFAKAVRSNPDLIDFDAIGKKAKDYQQQQYSYRGPGGETRQIGISPLFEYKMEIDPVVGTEVPVVTGINGVEAQKLIESDQDMKEAFDVFVKNRAELNKSKTYIDPQTGSPIMLRPEIAEQKAAEEFMNNAFGKYGKVKYGQSFQMPSRAGAGGGSEKQDYSYKENESIIESPVYDDANQRGYRKFSIGSSSDKGYPMGTTNHQAGLRGVPLSNTDKLSGIITDNEDGTWTINRSITYDNPKERTVYRAKSDIRFFSKNGNFGYTKKKGSILGNDEAGIVLSGPSKNLVRKESGYQITARAKSPVTDEEKEIVMYVSGPDAASIAGNINKFQKGKKPVRDVKKIVF
jgi:hypothetical protein